MNVILPAQAFSGNLTMCSIIHIMKIINTKICMNKTFFFLSIFRFFFTFLFFFCSISLFFFPGFYFHFLLLRYYYNTQPTIKFGCIHCLWTEHAHTFCPQYSQNLCVVHLFFFFVLFLRFLCIGPLSRGPSFAEKYFHNPNNITI